MPKTPLDEKIATAFIVAGCLIEKDSKFLLIQEKSPEVAGLWSIPAGKVEKGIKIAETAIKEVKEETGFEVELKRKIGTYHKEDDISVNHIFEANIIGGNLKIPEDEIMDARWYDYHEIECLKGLGKLRSDWVLVGINDLNRKRNRAKLLNGLNLL